MNLSSLRLIQFGLLLSLLCLTNASLAQDDDIAHLRSKEFLIDKNPNLKYILIAARNGKTPKDGYRLLFVLPGGDGSAGFTPFVKTHPGSRSSQRIRSDSVDCPEMEFESADRLANRWSSGAKHGYANGRVCETRGDGYW